MFDAHFSTIWCFYTLVWLVWFAVWSNVSSFVRFFSAHFFPFSIGFFILLYIIRNTNDFFLCYWFIWNFCVFYAFFFCFTVIFSHYIPISIGACIIFGFVSDTTITLHIYVKLKNVLAHFHNTFQFRNKINWISHSFCMSLSLL